MSKNLVIVESPAKAKTIEKYLGSDFKVMSSVGHIRKDTEVDIINDFAVTYEIDEGHKKIVADLKREAKAADTVWLATDEDREGESISWHLVQVLGLPADTNRITFHEITEPALKAAIKSPRTIDQPMVNSQQARQTLDMLVGYDLSGVVRKKVPGAKSAGRVQSPALRLIVEREREIEAFEAKSTFKITGKFIKETTPDQVKALAETLVQDPENAPEGIFPATMSKGAPKDENAARELLESFKGQKFTITDIEESEGQRANPVPLTTAALQIEANSRLGFSAQTTMRAAQGLYQAGLITYHRTDSLNLASQALASIANYIKSTYGEQYLHVRKFKTKDSSAQEAHEAIRPTHIENEIAGANDYERRLYNMIRNRTLATQMANPRVTKTNMTIMPGNFVAKGETIAFDGFLKVYGSTKETFLPNLQKGDQLDDLQIVAHQTFDRPPARYTEGSLVKKLEELGIGRPSTYATIMNAIQIRGYALKGESEGQPRDVKEIVLSDEVMTEAVVQEKTGSDKGKLLPTPVGELVSDFLLENFDQIVDYDFTAGIEQKLDRIAENKLSRVKMLRDFYTPFMTKVKESDGAARFNNARELGVDPTSGKTIYAKIGKNGGFIQLGDNEKASGEKPRFAPLPTGRSVKNVTLEQAIKQLAMPSLPRNLGKAKDGSDIIAASGPFGPYLKAGKYNIPIKDFDPYTITLAEAEPLYQKKVDSIIADWTDIMIIVGAYGPYIKGPGRRNNVKIPKDVDPKTITREIAEKMLAEKATPAKATAKSGKSTSRHASHKTTRKKSATAKKKTTSTSKAKTTKKSSK